MSAGLVRACLTPTRSPRRGSPPSRSPCRTWCREPRRLAVSGSAMTRGSSRALTAEGPTARSRPATATGRTTSPRDAPGQKYTKKPAGHSSRLYATTSSNLGSPATRHRPISGRILAASLPSEGHSPPSSRHRASHRRASHRQASHHRARSYPASGRSPHQVSLRPPSQRPGSDAPASNAPASNASPPSEADAALS